MVLPSLLAREQQYRISPSPDASWPWQLFRLQLLQEGENKEIGCGKRRSNPLGSDSPCSSPLSPLHASRLACAHLCGEECKTVGPLTNPHCCLPPVQPSTLSPELALHQGEVILQILTPVPGPESQARQPTLQRQDKERKKQVLPAEVHLPDAQEKLQPMLEHDCAINYF